MKLFKNLKFLVAIVAICLLAVNVWALCYAVYLAASSESAGEQ